MFYDINLMVHNSPFNKAWRAGNNQSSKSLDKNCENITLPAVCEELDKWVESDSLNPRRRLSLRTSSILINGASRLYRDEADMLLKDTFDISQQIMLNNYQSDARSEDDDESSTPTDSEDDEDKIQLVTMVEEKIQDTFDISQQIMLNNYQSDARSEDDDESSTPTGSEDDEDKTQLVTMVEERIQDTLTIFRRQTEVLSSLDGLVRGSTNFIKECNGPSNSNLEDKRQEE